MSSYKETNVKFLEYCKVVHQCQNSICCDNCDNWIHLRCSKIGLKEKWYHLKYTKVSLETYQKCNKNNKCDRWFFSSCLSFQFLTRLRVNLSHLNEHKFRHNFQDTLNPLCSCSLEPESITHYLLHCHFYNVHRKTLLDSLYDIDESISNLSEANLITLLLYGNSNLYSTSLNTKIINCTICYIKTSERFDIALF